MLVDLRYHSPRTWINGGVPYSITCCMTPEQFDKTTQDFRKEPVHNRHALILHPHQTAEGLVTVFLRPLDAIRRQRAKPDGVTFLATCPALDDQAAAYIQEVSLIGTPSQDEFGNEEWVIWLWVRERDGTPHHESYTNITRRDLRDVPLVEPEAQPVHYLDVLQARAVR